jgi:hypothetical protein
VSLPCRLLGSEALDFLAGGLIFVPWAGTKIITAINTEDLFHNHLLLLRENVIRSKNHTELKELYGRSKESVLENYMVGSKNS